LLTQGNLSNDIKLKLTVPDSEMPDEAVCQGAINIWMSTFGKVRSSGRLRKPRWVSGCHRPATNRKKITETQWVKKRRVAVDTLVAASRKRSYQQMTASAAQLSAVAWTENHKKAPTFPQIHTEQNTPHVSMHVPLHQQVPARCMLTSTT
jgi:hypothetical protein